jgi:hypothetical protein
MAGMPVQEAAKVIGINRTFMSTVYRSDVGQKFALHCEGLANNYVACLMALGLTPARICSSRDCYIINGRVA